MKVWVRFVCLFIGLVGWLTAVHADDSAGATRIAVVNVAQLLDEAPQAGAASEDLKAEYSPRELQLDAEQKRIRQLQDMLQQEALTLSPEEKLQRERNLRKAQRVFSRKLEDFREELRTARDSALEGVQNQIYQAIESVRIQQGVDIVLRESQFITASERVDITAKVLTHLQQVFGQPAEKTAPALTVPTPPESTEKGGVPASDDATESSPTK